jgi:hypothetical protein
MVVAVSGTVVVLVVVVVVVVVCCTSQAAQTSVAVVTCTSCQGLVVGVYFREGRRWCWQDLP